MDAEVTFDEERRVDKPKRLWYDATMITWYSLCSSIVDS